MLLPLPASAVWMNTRRLPLDFPTMQTNIRDIAGVRVICSFEEDVFFLAKC